MCVCVCVCVCDCVIMKDRGSKKHAGLCVSVFIASYSTWVCVCVCVCVCGLNRL